jgi:hypothetical protein
MSFLRDLFTLGYRVNSPVEETVPAPQFVPAGAHTTPAGEKCETSRSVSSEAVYHLVTRTVGPVRWEAGAIGRCPDPDALGDTTCQCGREEFEVPYAAAEKHAAACGEMVPR